MDYPLAFGSSYIFYKILSKNLGHGNTDIIAKNYIIMFHLNITFHKQSLYCDKNNKHRLESKVNCP